MGGKRRTKTVYARLVLDAFIQNGIFFCSAGVNHEEGDNLPHKILMLGFGGFILIVVSAYVANLAAFLTKSGVLDYIGTMDEVKAKGKKVCALPALKTELEISHPTATFVFSQAGKSYYGLIDDYDAQRCDFIAVGKEDAKSNIELMNMFCERDLVFTNSLIIENQVAFPIRPDLAAGLSYWIYQGAKYHGITVDTSMTEYDILNKRQASCQDFEFNEQEIEADEYTQITLKNLFPPIIFFLAFALIATVVQLYHKQWELKHGNSRSLLGRTSSLNFGPVEKHNLQDSKDSFQVRRSSLVNGSRPKSTMRRPGLGNGIRPKSMGLGNAYCDDGKHDCEAQDTTKARRSRTISFVTDVDGKCSDEEDNATTSRYKDITKAIEKRRDSTDSNTIHMVDEFYDNPSPAVVHRKRSITFATDVDGTCSDDEDDTENATSRLERLVGTGVFDEIIACVQEIKREKEN